MARSFEGRGMTLAQLNAATQAEVLKKQQAQQAALQKLAQEALLEKPVVKSATAAQTAATASQVKQIVQAAVKTSSSGGKTGSTASQTPSFSVGRTERVASAAPAVGDTVIRNGKAYTWGGNASQRAQIKAAEAAAKAAAEAAAAAARAVSALSTASKNTTLIGGNTASSGSSTYYEIDSALESIYKQATAAGASIAKPSSYGSSITDVARAQAIIDSYTEKANSAISAKVAESTVYDTSSQFQEVYNTARGYGVNVAIPAQTQYKTAAAAQAALDSYVEKVNNALANAPAPVYTNIDPQKTSGYSYTVTMSHAQQNELIRTNQTRKQQGKSELSEFEFRQSKGISTETTQGGNYVKPKLTNKSYSSNGSGTVKAVKDQGPNYSRAASVGSGDIKIANIKASAKTISPNNKAVTVISAADTQKQKQAAVAAKNAEAAKATAEAVKAAQAKKEAEAVLVAKQKALVKAQAAAKKTTSAPEKSALQQQAKTLQKDVNTSKTQVKAATEAANATAKYANAVGENVHYAEIAVNTGSAKAAQKANTALKAVKSTSARAARAVEKADAAGVTTHDGQILLKDGTWMNQVQKTGRKSTGESSVKLFGTTKAYQDQMVKEYQNKLAGKTTSKALNPVYKTAYDAAVAQKKAESALAKQVASNYKVILGKNGEIIDAVQANGKFGTGAGSVHVITMDSTGKVIAASKTAQAYQSDLKTAVKTAAIPITASTTAESKKLITNARQYVLARMSGSTKASQKTAYNHIDGIFTSELETKISGRIGAAGKALQGVSKKGTQGERVAKSLQAFSKGDLSENLKKSTGAYLNLANSGMAGALAPTFASLENTNKKLNDILAGISITTNAKGQVQISKKGKETLKNGVVFNAKAAKDSAKKNKLIGGVDTFLSSEYNSLKTKPVSYAAELGLLYVGGAAFGAATKVGTIGGRLALRGAGGFTGTVAEKVESKLLKTALAKNTKVMNIASKSLYLPSNVAKFGEAHGEKAVNAYLGYSLAKDAYKTVKTGNANEIGTAAKSFIVGGAGFGKGLKVGTKAYDRVVQLGGKEVPLESIIKDVEVLEGVTQFPTTKGANKAEFVKRFSENGVNTGYHASINRLPSKVTVRSGFDRPTDMPGLYVSPVKSGASPYFLRVEKSKGGLREFASAVETAQSSIHSVQKSLKKLNLKDSTSRKKLVKKVSEASGKAITAVVGDSMPLNPTVHKIEFGKVRSLPNRKSVKGSQEFLVTEQAKKGDAYLTPRLERGVAARAQRTEAEAVITPGTVLKRVTTQKRYFKFKDRLISLEDYKVMEAKGVIKKGEMGKREVGKKELKENYSRDPVAYKRGYAPKYSGNVYRGVQGQRTVTVNAQIRDVVRDYKAASAIIDRYTNRSRNESRSAGYGRVETASRSTPRAGRRVPETTRYTPKSGDRRTPTPGRRVPETTRYTPKSGDRRTPAPGRRTPETTRYTPKGGDRRTPASGRRVPEPQRYSPKPGKRTPEPSRHTPTPTRFTPTVEKYTPRPYNYTPKGGNYEPPYGKVIPPAQYAGKSHFEQHIPPLPLAVKRKKKNVEGVGVRKDKGRENKKRRIQNRLGSLESIFGDLSQHKRTKTTVKAVKKHTAKRGVRA